MTDKNGIITIWSNILVVVEFYLRYLKKLQLNWGQMGKTTIQTIFLIWSCSFLLCGYTDVRCDLWGTYLDLLIDRVLVVWGSMSSTACIITFPGGYWTGKFLFECRHFVTITLFAPWHPDNLLCHSWMPPVNDTAALSLAPLFFPSPPQTQLLP